MLICIESCLGQGQAGPSCSSPMALCTTALGGGSVGLHTQVQHTADGQNYHPSLIPKKTKHQTKNTVANEFGEVKNKVMPIRRKISLHIPQKSLKLLQPLVILDSFIQDSHVTQQRSKNTVMSRGGVER